MPKKIKELKVNIFTAIYQKILEKIKKIANIDFLIILEKSKIKKYLSHYIGVKNLSNYFLDKKLKFIQIKFYGVWSPYH